MKTRKIERIRVFLLLYILALNPVYAGEQAEMKNPALLAGWEDYFEDGMPSGATIYFTGGLAVVEGTSQDQNYGYASREIELDIDRYPVLEISVEEVSEGWYLVVHSAHLADGYKKLESFNGNTGIFEYNLKKTLKLSGIQRMRLSVGVVVERSGIKKNINQYMKFRYIRFKSAGAFPGPNASGAGFLDISAVSVRNRSFPPELLTDRGIARDIRRASIRKNDLSVPDSFKAVPGAEQLYDRFLGLAPEDAREREQTLFKISVSSNALVIKNNCYEMRLDQKDGSLLGVWDRSGRKQVLFPNKTRALWRMDFLNNNFLASTDLKFSYAIEAGVLGLLFTDSGNGPVVSIRIIPGPGRLDFEINIRNLSGQRLLGFSFPETLLFDYRDLEQCIVPFKIGIALNRKFYSQKRHLAEKYPNLFSDLVSIRLKESSCSVYGIQSGEQIFHPVSLETGYDDSGAGRGYYTRRFITDLPSGGEETLPVVRMDFQPRIMSVIREYAGANGIASGPDLEKKLGPELFGRLKRSVMLKLDLSVNGDFRQIQELLKELSAPALLHLVSYWKGGFDRNYPDYLPPDEQYGSMTDFESLVRAVRESGHLFMPYTNPTWWNESETLRLLDREKIAVRDLSGGLVTEEYNRSTGWVVNPFHTNVIKRIERTVKDFTEKLPADILFEDQVGARSWLFSSNPDMPSGISYIQGMISHAERNSRKTVLFTEEGFDRLIPYEAGFCNMSAAGYLPPDEAFDLKFGRGAWTVFPLALFLAHDKTAFYQHNLAHEVFADSFPKIAWNLLYGHNMNAGRWTGAWEKQKEDYRTADVIQKEISSACFGKPLSEYRELDKEVYLSRFEDMLIIGNFSPEAYAVDRYSIAPGGFLAVNKKGTLLAGLFTIFNGESLGGERLLLVKQESGRIMIRQLKADNCFITLQRPLSWVNNSSIEAFYGEEPLSVALEEKGMTLYLGYGQDREWYSLRYNTRKQTGLDLRPQVTVREDRADISVALLSFQKIADVKLGLTPYLVHPLGPFPDAGSGRREDEIFSTSVAGISPNEKILFPFSFPLGIRQTREGGLWLNISCYEKGKIIGQASVLAGFGPRLQLLLEQKGMICGPDEKKDVRLFIKNDSDQAVTGKILCRYPAFFNGRESIPFTVRKGIRMPLSVPFRSSRALAKGEYIVKYELWVKDKKEAEAFLRLEARPADYGVDFEPVNILILNRKNSLDLILRDLPLNFRKAKLSVESAAGWSIAGLEGRKELSMPEDNFLKIPFQVMPSKTGEGEIRLRLRSGKEELVYAERFKCIRPGEAGLLITDINADRTNEVIMGNGSLEMVLTPLIGGRVLKFINRATGHNQLFCDYPGVEIAEGSEWKYWAEYGGINDWWPSGWPGDVWNNTWSYKTVRLSRTNLQVLFTTGNAPGSMELSRLVALTGKYGHADFTYRFRNLSEDDITFFYNNHPDLAPGPGFSADKHDALLISVLSNGRAIRREVPFVRSMKKESFIPAENWVVAIDRSSGEYIGQLFEPEKVKEIGMWQGINFFTTELISRDFTLQPEKDLQFRYRLFTGIRDWEEKIEEIKKEVMSP